MIPRSCTLLHPSLSLQLWLGGLLVHQHPPPFQIHHRFPTFSSVKIIVNIFHQIFTCRKTTLMGENPNNWGELLRSSLTGANKSENVLFSPTFFTPPAFLGRKSSSEKSLSEKFFAGLFLVAFFGLSSSESSVDFFFGLAAFLGLVSFGGFSVKDKNFEQLILALPVIHLTVLWNH